MPFLIAFITAVVVIGALVIAFNLRAIRAEVEAEKRRAVEAAVRRGERPTEEVLLPDGAAPSAQSPAAVPAGPARPMADAPGRKPFVASSAAPDGVGTPVVAAQQPEDRQMTDDEYRAAIREMALGGPGALDVSPAAPAKERTDDPAFREGLREAGGRTKGTEPPPRS